jgi:type I restriction enzyme S subunit
MASNYKCLGNYIKEVKIKNTALETKTLLGINIDKFFMPSPANVIGTDMSTYRIVKLNQFACNRMHVGRDYRIPIALSKKKEPFIVSPAYDVFEIIDTSLLFPEYLMMWFSRKEFDRNAWFYTDADVRGGLPWKSFCNIQLPIPSITKQREVVEEYNVIQNRITLNNQLIQKLEETAQAIYKQWFVDFEFPNEKGKPYKSSGGKMVYNEELEKEIPLGWSYGVLSDITNIVMGQSPKGETYNKEKKGMIFYQGRTDFGFRFPDISSYTTAPTRKAKQGDILVSVRAPVGDLNIAIQDCSIGRGVAALRSKTNCNSFLFYAMQTLKSQFNISNDEGTVFGSINKDDLHGLKMLISENEIKDFDKLVSTIDKSIKLYSMQNQVFIGIKNLLLSKLATIEN